MKLVGTLGVVPVAVILLAIVARVGRGADSHRRV